MSTFLKPNDLILFQGDSITDAGRKAFATYLDAIGRLVDEQR